MKKKTKCLLVVATFGLLCSSGTGNSTVINITSPIFQLDATNTSTSSIETSTVTELLPASSTISILQPSQSDLSIVPGSCIELEDYVYDCKSPGGHFDIRHDKNDFSTYNFILEANEEAILYFSKENIPFLGENCFIQIGTRIYDDGVLLEENNIHLFNVSTTMKLTIGNPMCSFKMFYRIALPYIASAQLLDTEGIIEAPLDPDGLQNYRPMTTFVWYLQPSMQNCFLELIISKFELGSSTDVPISPETNSITAQYDFLSIGLDNNGSNTYDDDFIFFGNWNSPETELLPSCYARITFISKMHFQTVSGFRIDYKAKDIILPENNADPPSRLSTWIAINGASIQHDERIDDIFPVVKQAIAEVANDYLKMKMINMNVSQDNVIIYEVGTCSIFYCQYNCMAFYFSIDLKKNKNETFFTANILNQMVSNTEIVIVVATLTVCHEIPYINWSFPLFFLLLVICCSFALIALSICERDDAYRQKRKENLRYLISDWGTPWRRQSISDMSTSSASSQTPFVKKRFYFPGFGTRHKVKQTNYQTYDLTEFKDFKSKPVDPNVLGLNEFTPNSTTELPMEFSNTGYIDDDELFNKYSTLNSPESLSPETPNIPAEQSFHNANPFRHEMAIARNTLY